jgi:hypothetical protein
MLAKEGQQYGNDGHPTNVPPHAKVIQQVHQANTGNIEQHLGNHQQNHNQEIKIIVGILKAKHCH